MATDILNCVLSVSPLDQYVEYSSHTMRVVEYELCSDAQLSKHKEYDDLEGEKNIPLSERWIGIEIFQTKGLTAQKQMLHKASWNRH